ncbi:hypothetical protein LptCag_2384 [Leptospirillum ferriphilum]|uniref:Uncharacterized protein n=1 Tax=Leptospirillum ferriphilum TaxID=178606 RepID=A0A094WEI4_9BACT|nr:hypothetical protein LptCag_2384 [Leptospirillum ferriphilum]
MNRSAGTKIENKGGRTRKAFRTFLDVVSKNRLRVIVTREMAL